MTVTDASRGRRVGAALFLLLLAVQALNFSGVPHSSDGIAMLATAESLVRRGDLDMNSFLWMGLQQGSFGPDGELYSRKGMGQSLAALPLAWLGLRMKAVGLFQASMLLGPLVAACTGWLLYRSLLGLGYSPGAALAAALALGLATPALPYGKYFFSDPLTGLALLGAFAGWLRYRARPSALMAAGVGAALGVAVLTRTTSLALAPVFALGLWWGRAHLIPHSARRFAYLASPASAKRRGERDHLSPTGGRGVGGEGRFPSRFSFRDRGSGRGSRLGHLLAFGLGLTVFVALSGWFNMLRFGDPLTSGYLPQESFSGDLLAGVAGLLVSPGRGLFLYAPILLLALPGWVGLRRRDAGPAWLVLSDFALHVLIYGKWFMWHGGYCWGPRFLLPTLPFLALALAPVWERGGPWRRGFLILGAVSLVPQVLGALVHFAPFQDDLLLTGLPLFHPRTFWDPAYSPLLRQWAYVRPEALDFAWAQRAGAPASLDLAALAALLVALGLATAALVRSLRGRAAVLLTGAALALMGSWGVLVVRSHAAGAHILDPLLQLVETHERPGDALLALVPADSVPICDRYGGRLPVYSTAAPDEDLPAGLVSRYRRFWVLADALGPGAESWLGDDAYPALAAGSGDRRLSLYLMASGVLAGSRVDRLSSDGAVLQEVATLEQGDDLLVRLTWLADSRPSHDYKVFVHVLDRSGTLLAQSDAVPVGWTRPTSSWRPGEVIVDRHGLVLPSGASPALVRVGLYEADSGQRLEWMGGVDAVDVPLSP